MSDSSFDLTVRATRDPHAVIDLVDQHRGDAGGLDLARLLLAEGIAYRALLRPTAAHGALATGYELACEPSGDPAAPIDRDLPALLCAELAACEIDLGRPEKALDRLTAYDPGGDDLSASARGRLSHITGLAYQRMGSSQESTRHYERALALYRQARQLLGAGQVHTNLAILATHDGRVDSALEDLDHASEAFTAIDNENWKAITVLNRGWAVGVGGNLPRSLQLLGEAEILLRTQNLPDGLRVVSRAEVLLQAGLYGAARSELNEAIMLFEEQELSLDRAEALILASIAAEAEGEIEEAVALLRRAMAQLDEQVRPGWIAAAQAAEFRLECRTGEAADPVLRRASELANIVSTAGQQRLVPMIWLNAAWASLDRNDAEAAEAAIHEANRGPDSTELRAFMPLVRSRLLEASGQPERAIEVLDEGYRTLEEELRLLGGIDMAALAAASVAEIVSRAKRLLADGSDSKGFLLWSDRARQIATWRWPRMESPEISRLLNQARALAPLGNSLGDPSTDAKLDDLRRTIRDIRWQQENTASPMAKATTDGSPLIGRIEVPVAGHEAIVIDLTKSADAWYIGAVQRAAPGDGDDFLWTHRRVELDHQELAAACRVSRLFQTAAPDLRLRILGDLKERLEPLNRIFLDQLADDENGFVLLSVDDDLADIPWPILPALWDRPLSVLPTRRHLQAASDRSSSRSGASVIIGPDLETDGAEIDRLAPLVARQVHHTRPRKLSDFQSALDRRVAYVAAHGGPEPNNPLFNWLGLDCGRVFLHDLMFFDRVPETVILAACYAGQTMRMGPGGTASFANGFLGVGSRWVISAATALVDDDDLVGLGAAVLQEVLSGTQPPHALAAVRRAIGAPEGSPVAAAFTCYGG